MVMSAFARVLIPAAASFVLGIATAPILTRILYRHRAWKKRAGKTALDGSQAHVFNRLHNGHETRAPRMGGILVWGTVTAVTIGSALLARMLPVPALEDLDLLSRSQTWIPLAALLVGAFVGLIDDLLTIREDGKGLRLRTRLSVVFLLAALIGWWFWAKLAVTAVTLPGFGMVEIGAGIIPLFIAVSLALYASGVIDGIDGLSGGVFASIFAAYTVIAFAQYQIDLAAFCATLVGGLLAFLWFNIPPARFYMSDTGTMALTLTLAVIAFMTDSLGGGVGIAVLPVIGALLVATVLSNILQIFWKRVFGRKLLLVAPLHHHFEALGWPGYKVTMRYWVLSVIFAFAGVIIALESLT